MEQSTATVSVPVQKEPDPRKSIVLHPEPILYRPAAIAGESDFKAFDKIALMWKVMHHFSGVGIAAPQIGWGASACIIGQTKPGTDLKEGTGLLMFNPTIKAKGALLENREGCLSLPGVVSNPMRYAWVVVSFMDMNGLPQEQRFEAPYSFIVQHEIDHLQGMTIYTKMSPADRAVNSRAMKVLEMRRRK